MRLVRGSTLRLGTGLVWGEIFIADDCVSYIDTDPVPQESVADTGLRLFLYYLGPIRRTGTLHCCKACRYGYEYRSYDLCTRANSDVQVRKSTNARRQPEHINRS
jgi:hypothetical protein